MVAIDFDSLALKLKDHHKAGSEKWFTVDPRLPAGGGGESEWFHPHPNASMRRGSRVDGGGSIGGFVVFVFLNFGIRYPHRALAEPVGSRE